MTSGKFIYASRIDRKEISSAHFSITSTYSKGANDSFLEKDPQPRLAHERMCFAKKKKIYDARRLPRLLIKRLCIVRFKSSAFDLNSRAILNAPKEENC